MRDGLSKFALECTRSRTVLVEPHSSGAIVFVCFDRNGIEVTIQPPSSAYDVRLYPGARIHAPLFGWPFFGNEASTQGAVGAYSSIKSALGGLRNLIASQARLGKFARAAHYRVEIQEAIRLVQLAKDTPGAVSRLRQCRSIRALSKACREMLGDVSIKNSASAAAALELLTLELNHGVNPRSAMPDLDASLNRSSAVSAPTSPANLRMDLPQRFVFDVDADALVSLTDDVLVALVRRAIRYDVIVQYHGPGSRGEPTNCRSPFDMGSVCIGVQRAPAEPDELHLARLHASVQAGIALAPLLARRVSPVERLDERWAVLHFLALGGQLHYATSFCVLPVPNDAHGWRCLVRSHDTGLRLVRLSEPGMGLVSCTTWTGPPAPDMGAGLAKDDHALRGAFEPLEILARAYWSGEVGSTEQAKRSWRLAIRRLVRKEWWATYEALAGDFLRWG